MSDDNTENNAASPHDDHCDPSSSTPDDDRADRDSRTAGSGSLERGRKDVDQLYEEIRKNPELIERIVHIASTQHAEYSYHVGPLPPAAELERYVAAHPDAARVIFEMAEAQSNAAVERTHAESNVILINAKTNRDSILRAQIIGALGLFAFLGLTVLALVLDRPWFAGLAFFAAVIVAFGAYIKPQQPEPPTDSTK